MISLPNSCNCSEITVTPKDWKTCKASAMARNWYIQYYFYDTFLRKRKFVLVKGMNRFKSLTERRQATAELIENELYQLREKGFNPITGNFFIEKSFGIDSRTGFVDALNKAFDLLKLEATTRQDISRSINFFTLASKKMIIDFLEFSKILLIFSQARS